MQETVFTCYFLLRAKPAQALDDDQVNGQVISLDELELSLLSLLSL